MYRYIECSIWQNKEMEEFNSEEKLLWIYLFTNNATDSCGIYQVSIRRMAFDTGIPVARVAEILKKFENADPPMAIHDGNEIVIPSFIKHQANRSPKILFHIAKQLEKAKNKKFVRIVLERNDSVSIPYEYPIDTSIDKDKDKDKDKEIKDKGHKKRGRIPKQKSFEITKDVIAKQTNLVEISEPFKTKSEKIDALVELITDGLYPVGSKDKLERAMKTYGFEKMVQAVERCKEYYAFVKTKKIKRYVFAKRFSKFIENIATFTDEELFRERLRLMEKWANEPDNKIDPHRQWLQVGAHSPDEEQKTQEPDSEYHALIKMMNHTLQTKNSYERLLHDKTQCKKFPDKVEKWKHEFEKANIEYQNLLKKVEEFENAEKKENELAEKDLKEETNV